MEVVWKPVTGGIFNDVIVFSDSRGVKKDVKLVMKAVDTRKAAAPKAAPQLSKRLKPAAKKAPVVSRMVLQHKANVIGKVATSTPTVQHSAKAPLSESNFNASNIFQPPDLQMLDTIFEKTEKENKSPITPPGDLFSQIRFTPATEKINKEESCLEYLASLPTPTGERLRPSIKLPQPRTDLLNDISVLASMVTPKTVRKVVTIIDPNSPSVTKKRFNDETFVPSNHGSLERLSSETYVKCSPANSFLDDEPPVILVNNETRVISPHPGLSMIAEESEIDSRTFRSETFHIKTTDSKAKIEEVSYQLDHQKPN